jgi:hypothetical protein
MYRLGILTHSSEFTIDFGPLLCQSPQTAHEGIGDIQKVQRKRYGVCSRFISNPQSSVSAAIPKANL